MAHRPTVLHLIYTLSMGGAERLTCDITSRLQQQGRYRPVVCAWRRGGPVLPLLRQAGVTTFVANLPRRRIWSGPCFVRDLARIYATLVKIARSENVRLIHAHMSDCALLGLILGRRLRRPVVVSVHSNHLIPYDHPRGTLRYFFRLHLLRWSLRRADRIVAVSPTVKDTIHDVLKIRKDRITVITNGIALPSHMDGGDGGAAQIRSDLGFGPDARLLICVGRLVPNKGQPTLIAMLPHVLQEHPAARLVLVGEGPSEKHLRSQAARLGLEHAVVFAGRCDDVPRMLHASEVFVSASWSEGVSLAILEAMAAGLAVVSAAAPGNMEVLTDGAGILVQEENAADFAASVNSVLSSTALAARLSCIARARIRERYSIDRVITEVTDIYEQLLRPPGKPCQDP